MPGKSISHFGKKIVRLRNKLLQVESLKGVLFQNNITTMNKYMIKVSVFADLNLDGMTTKQLVSMGDQIQRLINSRQRAEIMTINQVLTYVKAIKGLEQHFNRKADRILIADVAAMSLQEFNTIRYVGRKSLSAINDMLTERGYSPLH